MKRAFVISTLYWTAAIIPTMIRPEPLFMPPGSTLLDVPGLRGILAAFILSSVVLGALTAQMLNNGDRISRNEIMASGAILGLSYALVHYTPFILQFVPMIAREVVESGITPFIALILKAALSGTLNEALFAATAAISGAMGGLLMAAALRLKTRFQSAYASRVARKQIGA
ncbi:MAG: hypothetical protein HY327_12735 [Chloroflexi bacterium]|nr:hypothetical protein [Chloroflexota bacterium]